MIFKGKEVRYLFDRWGEISGREQFPYSERLLDLRVLGVEGYEMSSWDFKEVAKMAGKTPDEYIKFEYADDDISIEEYKEVIRKVTDKMISVEEQVEVEDE